MTVPAASDRFELHPVPPDLSALFGIAADALKPVLAVRMRGYMSASSSPFRPVTREAVNSLDDQGRRAALVYLLAVALQQPRNRVFRVNEENAGNWVLTELGRRKLAWTPDQLAWLLRFVRVRHDDFDGFGLNKIISLLTTAAERAKFDLTPMRGDLLWLRDWIVEATHQDHHSWSWMGFDPKTEECATRLHVLLGSESRPTLAAHVLDGRDSFGPRARAAMLSTTDESTAAELMSLLATFGTAPRPSQRWRLQAIKTMTERPELVRVARALVATATTQRDPVVPADGWVEHWIHPDSQKIIRAAAWAVSLVQRDAQTTSDLRDLGTHYIRSAPQQGSSARSLTIVNAIIAALAERAVDQPTGELASAVLSIRQRASNRRLTDACDQAISIIAEAAGVTVSELTEQSVPSFGLDRAGTLTRRVGEYGAVVRARVDGNRVQVSLSWVDAAGRDRAGVPTAVRRDHPQDLADLQRLVKDIRTALPALRTRLDLSMSAHRRWTPDAWIRDLVGHPLVGLWARSLIWTCRSRAGLPERIGDDWGLRTLTGELVMPTDRDEIQLWHPLGRPLDDVLRWRAHISEAEITQPFKQAFREIYLLTPAEEATGSYSNRFAAHILRYRQAAALLRGRGWRTPGLGIDYEADAGDAIRDLGPTRARFALMLVDHDELEADLCSTDRVYFELLDAAGNAADVPLNQVDPLILSETLRDLDLCVAVSSIGADPSWLEEVGGRHRTYWEEFSFGPLTASAATRREAVERIIPKTKIADRARVEGRFLIVQGQWRTYKIHLGSGNVLMSPNDAYLCIVAGHRGGPQVYLPFEEDGRLGLILSKAFLLADDTSITDPDIVGQIGPANPLT